MPKQRRQNLAERDRGSFYKKQKEWLEAFLDNKSEFLQNRDS